MSIENKYSIKNLKADFPNDEAVLGFIFDTLHSRSCSCGGTYRQVKGRRQFQCSKCRFQIAPASGTIFHKSDTPLSSWLHAIWIFSNAKSGISAKEMERQLGVTYKCAWRILSQIRKALKQNNKPLRGIVEMDSAYIGGRRYGGKNNEQLSRAVRAKSVVTIAVERGGRMKAEVRPNVTADELEDFIMQNIEEKSSLMTDNAKGYQRAKNRYDLQTVDHGKGEYVRGQAHVNRIETFISHLKRSIKGTYKTISKEHLQSYVDSFVFHYNNRYNDKARFSLLLETLLHA